MPLVSLTFARELTPRELLERMGADPDTLAIRAPQAFDDDFGDLLFDDDGYVVQAGRYGQWAWAWEEGSWLCVEDSDLVLRVSAGTEALVLHKNEKPMTEFLYARDGDLIVGINTLLGLTPDDRSGSAPDHFDSHMRSLGADPEAGDYGPLGYPGLFYRLAEGLGVGLLPEDLTINATLSGRLQNQA